MASSASISAGDAARRGLLAEEVGGPVGRRAPRVDGVDVDAGALAEHREPLGEIGHRCVDRAADQEIGAGTSRGAADDVDDVALRRSQHRPEQPTEPHAGEEFEREAVLPDRVGEVDERARPCRARRIHENVAPPVTFGDGAEDRLAALDRSQISGDNGRPRGSGRRDLAGRPREIGRRCRGEHGLRAGLGEGGRNGASDAAAAAGDDDDFSP